MRPGRALGRIPAAPGIAQPRRDRPPGACGTPLRRASRSREPRTQPPLLHVAASRESVVMGEDERFPPGPGKCTRVRPIGAGIRAPERSEEAS